MGRPSTEHCQDLIDAGAYTVDELREAAFGSGGRVSRPLAVALLGRKDFPDKVRDFARLLGDEREVPRLRAMAAQALGDIGSAAAIRALERGLESKDGVALRGVTLALARVGTQKHLAALRALASRPGPVGRTAAGALDVLAMRIGAPGYRLPSLGDEFAVERGQPAIAIAIDVATPSGKDAAAAAESAPGRKLARTGGLMFHCQGRGLMFLFDDAVLKQGLDALGKRGEIGVVAGARRVEAKGWEHQYSVLVEPTGKGSFNVLVTTADGRPALRGQGQVHVKEATYRVVAVDLPGAVPVDIRGRFDGRRLMIDEARSGQRGRPARTPLELRRGGT